MQARHPIHQFLANLRDEPRIDFQAIKAPIKYQSSPSPEIIDLSYSSPPAPIKQVPENVIDLISPLKHTRKLAHVTSPNPDVAIFGPPAKHTKNEPVLTLPMVSGPDIVLSDDSEIEDLSVKPDCPDTHSKLQLNINLKSLTPFDDEKNTPNLMNQLGATPRMLGKVVVGSVYNSMEAARDAVYTQEKNLGHIWRMGQSKRSADGTIKKVTLRCNHYYHHIPSHLASIDPSDHRKGKTIKTECLAHVNVNRIQGGFWHITTVAWEHNHQREVPVGGIVSRPPTQAQRELVAKFSDPSFSRGTLKTILAEHFPTHILEPRQITNLLNDARREARAAVTALGGDASAILNSLREKGEREHGWRYQIQLDEDQVLIGLWWQSPAQVTLLQRFYDLLITDNSYNRNQYGYPLNIGIIIDNFGKSRNAWYAFHRSEDIATHTWVFQCHLDAACKHPEVVASDRHPSLIASVPLVMPLSHHIYCLHHLNGNVTVQLRAALGSDWINFNREFWATYRAVSPVEFDRLWDLLVSHYPAAKQYLEEELYPCREKWAWPWIMTKFTAGVRTNGRAEAENKTSKTLGNAKKTLLQVFDALNQRRLDQTDHELIQVREVTFF